MSEVDPFTQIFNAFWEMLEASEDFCRLVPLNNRRKESVTSRLVQKPSVQSADLPEVYVVPTSITPHLNSTSNSSCFTVSWEIRVTTGDQRATQKILELSWVIIRALANWQTKLGVLSWMSQNFAKEHVPLAVNFDDESLEMLRGIRGWFSVWSGQTTVWIRTLDVKG